MIAPPPPPYSALYWFDSTWYSSTLSRTMRTWVPWLPPRRSSLLYMPSSRYTFCCDGVPFATTCPPSNVEAAGFGVMPGMSCVSAVKLRKFDGMSSISLLDNVPPIW
jgi:hypothetical protein